jgi:hypothetical protein
MIVARMLLPLQEGTRTENMRTENRETEKPRTEIRGNETRENGKTRNKKRERGKGNEIIIIILHHRHSFTISEKSDQKRVEIELQKHKARLEQILEQRTLELQEKERRFV